LTHLTFGYNFNQPLILSNSLTHLTFGNEFNKSINLPNSLTHLTFERNFNQLITLPNSLTHLTFGDCFNQKVNLIDENTGKTFRKIKCIKFGEEFCSELLIGPVEDKYRKVKININLNNLRKIFPHIGNKQYDFDNYIISSFYKETDSKKTYVI